MKIRQIVVGIVTLLTVMTAFAVIPATTVKAAPAGPQNILYVAMQQDLPDFDTWNLASNGVWKSNVINWGFETLAALDMNLVPYPLLAQSWTLDQSTAQPNVTINLRHDVHFQDGTLMTADDVVAMYTYARSGTTYSANIINAFDNNGDGSVSLAEIQADVVKLDTYTVWMHMPKVYGQFFTSTLGVPILPKHIWKAFLTDTTSQLIDVTQSNVNMTIGTGPMMYAGGVPSTYRVMDRFDGYWGKNFTTPYMHKRIYPAGVDEIYFKIYASIDTAILALQSHAVDYISWAITPGRVSSLQADPSIGLEYLSENGYYYMAFNQKFEPMNNLTFRKATSYLIDKDQIVNLYMGGFGTKGAAAEPPFWDVWQNKSVPTYPYDGTLATSKALLTAAGYVDVNGDGWRELPSGAPMQKITILTPPADYDPIRIRAGQMIALNLREAGINAEAKAIDFNTLVARLQTMDYQMLIIGWQLSSEPVGNVFDILGPKANSNTFGFWAADDPNPFYKDLMGVNTLADAPTQALARQVDTLAGLARGTFNVSDQIKYTLWGEGALDQAIPVNVLYYRLNIEAYSKTWSGWTPYMGSLWYAGGNIFNLANLQKTGSAGTSAAAAVNLAVTLPGTVGVGKSATGFVKAVDQLGYSIAGATVNVTTAGVIGAATVQVTPTSGVTDANGVLSISATGTTVGYSYVNVTASKGGVSATKSLTISSVSQYPKTIYVTAKPGKLVLRVGETTTVSLKATDEKGLPIAGVNLTADKNLISYGSLDHLSVLTDANGLASAIFSAPAALTQINAHEPTTLFYSATNAVQLGYTYATSPAVNMLIYNPAAPAWVMAKVNTVSKTNLVAAPGVNHNVSTIKIQAVDDSGAALANHKMTVTYSNSSIVVSPVTTVTTDGTGNATFNVQIAAGALTQGLRVIVQNGTTLMRVPATITLTYVDLAPSAAFYGGWMTFDTSLYMAPLGSVKVTAHVFDSNGNAADGINASLVLSGTAYGSLTGSDIINWDSAASGEGLGINIVSSADKANVVTAGPINTYFDQANWQTWYDNGWLYWDWGTMTGVDISSGLLTFWINGSDVAPLDLIGSIYLVPDGMGFFNDTTLAYEIDGPSMITSQYVIGRSYAVVAPSFDVAKPELVATLAAHKDTTTVNVTVTDENNVPVAGASVDVYEKKSSGGSSVNADYRVILPSGPTDALGKAQAIVNASKTPSADVKADLYVKASMPGAIAIFQQTQIYIYITHTFVTIAPITDAVAIGSESVPITATVVDWAGTPITDTPVELTADVGTVLGDSVVNSNAAGVMKYNISTPMPLNTRVMYMTLQAKAGAPTYDVSLGYLVLTLQNAGPQISAALQASKGAGGMVFDKGVNVTLSGKVFDPLGINATSWKLDTGSSNAVTGVSVGLGNDIRTIETDLGASLAVGTHTVRINATDALGVSNELVLTFEVKEHKATSTMLPWSIAVIALILFAVVLALLLMARRPKAEPETTTTTTTTEEAPKT